jgi:hypothetical protein
LIRLVRACALVRRRPGIITVRLDVTAAVGVSGGSPVVICPLPDWVVCIKIAEEVKNCVRCPQSINNLTHGTRGRH